MKCEICGREFENKNRLSIHLSRTHKMTSKEGYCRIWDCGNLKFKIINEEK